MKLKVDISLKNGDRHFGSLKKASNINQNNQHFASLFWYLYFMKDEVEITIINIYELNDKYVASAA